MNKFGIIAIAILSVLMLVSLYPVKADRGTRTNLDITWYVNTDSAYTALKADEVDMIQWSLTLEQKVEVEANPDLQLGAFSENGLWEFDLNNEPTIPDYPTSLSPTSVLKVRQAIACLVDKTYIVQSILGGFGVRLDAPICFPQTVGWVDPSVVSFDWDNDAIINATEDQYPYKYSISDAVDYLADLGFNDTDDNGYLNYPDDPMWLDKAGNDTTLMPLKICIRNGDAPRLQCGRLLVSQLEGAAAVPGDSALANHPQWAVRGLVGGDFDTTDALWEAGRPVLKPIVMEQFNYHVYTGGWSFGRYPTYQFSLFHSMFHYPSGPNYLAGAGIHPAYDLILEDLYYAANVGDAQAASKAATVYHVTNVVNIPLWSFTSFVAWRKELAGVVNMKGVGTVNDYTFLNAWRVKTTEPLRFACVSSWDILNVMYSQWYFEYALLDRVYNGLINANPYDLAIDLPWGAQDWEVGTWTDPRTGTDKTTVTYWLNKGQGCAGPENGTFSGNFSAIDYMFSCWYNYAYDDDWQWSSFMDINHIERDYFPNGTLHDPFKVKVYFDDVSMWFVYAPIYPMMGPANILRPLLCSEGSTSFTGADLVESPPGYFEYGFTADKVVLVKYATKNGANMTEGVDYYIRAGYDTFTHNVFVPMTAFAPGDQIFIKYYYAIYDGAGGLYIGGNLGYDWEDTMYAYGYAYPLSISGTNAALNKNPYYFMEMVPKGEIDFRYYFKAGTKPRSGNYKIDILDVVKCTGAYSTKGDQAFNELYLAGADIDDNDLCHIGILDLVTITGKYANTWGKPPA